MGFSPRQRGFYQFPQFSMAYKRKEQSQTTATADTPDQKKNPPIKVFVVEDVSASVFSREYTVKGEMRTFYSVSFSRSYRDSSGNRRYVKTFNLEDLGKVVHVCQEADDYIRGLLKTEGE